MRRGNGKIVKKKRGVPGSLDWDALKADFMQGNETLREFHLRHKLAASWFYGKAGTWADERSEIRNKAVIKSTEQQAVRHYSKVLKHVEDSELALVANCKAILSRSIVDGRVVKPLSTSDLLRLSISIEKILKTSRLGEGLSNGEMNGATRIGIGINVNGANGAGGETDVHGATMIILQELKDRGISEYNNPPTIIDH